MAYPLFHPRSRRRVQLRMSRSDFRLAFPAESEHVEWKAGASSKAIERTVTAFSNSDGGVLLLGVDDEGEVVGRSLTPGVDRDVTQAILRIHDPGRYWIHEVEVDGRLIVVLAIAGRSQGFAQTADGQVLIRKGANSVPLVGSELLQFLTARRLTQFDAQDSGVPMSAADPELLEEVREAYGWRSRSIVDRLAAEGLVVADGSRPMLTVAGALALVDDPTEHLGKAFVELLRFAGEGVDYDRRIEFRGPVHRVVTEATRALMAELGTDLVVSGVRRLELPKLPEVVLREAVSNAIAHRSYEELGRSVRIEMRQDKVVVESPGGLPEPVTTENIRDTQSARNIRVLKLLRRFKLAEDSGRGVDVIQDSMAEALLDPPVFEDRGHSVRVTLPIRGAITPQERAWVLETERQGVILPRDRILLVHAARGSRLTNEIVRDLLGVDSRDARTALGRLRDAGFLDQFGERGGSYYLLSTDVSAPAAFRLTPVALRRMVLSLAQEGPITNAVVRDATGLDRAEVLRILNRLVDERKLVRVGERRGARYVIP